MAWPTPSPLRNRLRQRRLSAGRSRQRRHRGVHALRVTGSRPAHRSSGRHPGSGRQHGSLDRRRGATGLAVLDDQSQLLAAIGNALRPQVDTMVVFLHWGTEMEECPTARQTQLAASRGCQRGHHPGKPCAHPLAGGLLDGSLVDYGLGNQFRGARGPSAVGGVLAVTVTGQRIEGYRSEPHADRGGCAPTRRGRSGRPGAGRVERAPRCSDLEPWSDPSSSSLSVSATWCAASASSRTDHDPGDDGERDREQQGRNGAADQHEST